MHFFMLEGKVNEIIKVALIYLEAKTKLVNLELKQRNCLRTESLCVAHSLSYRFTYWF